jgi:hypothetical protein
MRRRAEAVREDRMLAVLALAREALLAAVQAARPVEAPLREGTRQKK